MEDFNKIPDAEQVRRRIPDTLKPREDGPRFPELTIKDARELADEGWERVGIIVLLVNPEGQVLVVVHGPTDPRVREGTMGVISETLKISAESVEQPVAGISRLLAEELGLTSEQIESLNVETVEHGAWQNVTFPLGGDREALGLVIVLRADEQSANTIIRTGANFTPTTEIKFANFVAPEPLAQGAPVTENFRKGTPQIFQAGMDLLTTPSKQSRLVLPPPQEPPQNATDDLKDLLRP